MGLLDFFFGILDDFESDDYVEASKRWFDSAWKRLNCPSKGKGILFIENGMLFRRLYVSFDDDTTFAILDGKDKGRELKYVKFNQRQKDELLNKGYVILKFYH